MIEIKFENLKRILADMENVLVAYSGGVDSTFLAKTARDVLGEKALAVTARSETYVKAEYEQAVAVAKEIGIARLVIETRELEYPNYASNPINRCYYCKKELFAQLLKIAEERGILYVLDGSNTDDASDFRPGLKALKELGIRSPLKEAGLNKEEIRILSKQLGLPTWDKPAVACLGSRFPYGTEITLEKLDMLEQAEELLHQMNFNQVRVRHHENMARIEVLPEEISLILSPDTQKQIVEKFKSIGYHYITLDLEGYRSGSMNEILKKEEFETYTSLQTDSPSRSSHKKKRDRDRA